MLPNLTNPINQLALLCALAFIPHIPASFTSRSFVLDFYKAAGLKPVTFFYYFVLLLEIFIPIALVFGILFPYALPYAAGIAAIFMLTAAAMVFKISGGRWVWNLGGCEFHVFWGVCCIIVAVHSWGQTQP